MTHSLMRRDFRVTSHVRPFAAALLLAWVLAAHVFVAFPRARTKLVTRPVAVTPRVALPLDAAARMPGEEVVLVYRVRNAGTAPLVVTARLGDRVLRDVRIAGGASTRVDLTFPRALVRVGGHSIELSGSADWTLEYAELANLHGFTRGPVEFLVLPAVQPFPAPGLPTVMAFAACALAAASLRLPPRPRWARLAHGTVTAAVVTLLLLAIVSPWVTPYRVVFAVHTFVLGAAVVALPRGLRVLVEAGRSEAVAFIARRAAALPWKPLGISVAAGAYVMLLWSHMGATAGQSDSSGYMNNARLIASGRVTAPMRDVPGVWHNLLPARAYVPLGFRPHGRDALAPTYPVGLPLMLVAAVPALGWAHAPGVVMLLHALAGVALTALLARSCGLPGAAALVAAVILATSPLYLFMSVQLMSDTPALVWTTAAVLAACRGTESRKQVYFDVAAGAAASIAVLVRPTNVLVLLPLAFCLGLSRRRWLRVAAGGVPGAVFLAGYNLAAYGSAVTTGYGDTRDLFSLGNVVPSLRSYATWLPVVLTPVGVLVLGLPAIAARAGRMAAVLLAWAGGVVAVYTFYYHTHETWWYLRFLLPSFPPLIVGALWVGVFSWSRMSPRGQAMRASRALAVLVMALVVVHNTYWTRRLGALQSGWGERVYDEATAWATAHLPANAAVLTRQASGAFFYHTTFPIVRWDVCERATLQRLERAASGHGTPLYAVLFSREITELGAFDRVPGRWTQIGQIRHVSVWRFEGPAEAGPHD